MDADAEGEEGGVIGVCVLLGSNLDGGFLCVG